MSEPIDRLERFAWLPSGAVGPDERVVYLGIAQIIRDQAVEPLQGLLRKLEAAGFIPDKTNDWVDGDLEPIVLDAAESDVLRQLWKGTL